MLPVRDRSKVRETYGILAHRIGVCLIVGVMAWSMSATVRGQPAPTCSDVSDDLLLRCVRGLVEAFRKEGSSPAIFSTRLRPGLELLADKEGYSGSDSDLDELKRLSLELKAANKIANYDSISILDNAISSHIGEIRPALSWQAIATKAPPGTNIQPAFVQQKLDFLRSSKASFYDNGPFDLVRRSLLAGAFEDHFFLERSSGKDGRADLLSELSVVDDLIGRLENPEYDYLLKAQHKAKDGEINNQIFWRATILFLLGNKPDMRDALKKLALRNREFGLQVRDASRQVYSYRVFNEPYQILVGPSAEGNRPRVTIKDDNLVKRFFNASQLALLVCGSIDDAGATKAETEAFKKVVVDFDFYDYFVVLTAGQDADRVKRLDEAMARALDQGKAALERNAKTALIAGESKPLLSTMQAGAQKCAVSGEDRDRIYSAFSFKSQVKQIDGTWYLLFGGWLSANQATDIARFLNELVLPEVRNSLPQSSGSELTFYVARSLVAN